MTRSILPNSSPEILKPLEGIHGTFQVKLLPNGDHELYLGTNLIAIHNNGFSCYSLAKRIVDAWNGVRTPEHALEQFDYILRCGGLGIARSTVEWIIRNSPEV